MLWDADRGQQTLTLAGHELPVLSVSISADGNYVASASKDETIEIWDTSTGKLLHTLRRHTSRVVSDFFSPAGNGLASSAQPLRNRQAGLQRMMRAEPGGGFWPYSRLLEAGTFEAVSGERPNV